MLTFDLLIFAFSYTGKCVNDGYIMFESSITSGKFIKITSREYPVNLRCGDNWRELNIWIFPILDQYHATLDSVMYMLI